MHIIDFDIATLFLLFTTIYLYYTRKRIANDRSRRYGFTLWAILGSTVFNLAKSIALNSPSAFPPWATMSFATVYCVFHRSVPFLLALYVMTVSGTFPSARAARALFNLPWAASLCTISLNAFTGILFTVDGNGAYREHAALYALYAPSVFYLALTFWSLFSKKGAVSRRDRSVFLTALILPVISAVINGFNRWLEIECFTASLNALFVLLTIQNNFDLMDSRTGLYNRQAFLQFLQQAFERKGGFTLLIAHSAEMADMQGMLDAKTYVEITNSVSDWFLRAAGKQVLVFGLDDGQYAIMRTGIDYDDPIGNLALKVIERSHQPWSLGSLQIDLLMKIGILNCPDDAVIVPDVLDYIDQLSDMSVLASDRHLFFVSDFIPNKHRREAAVASSLGKALKERKLELRYQPLHSIAERRAVALEVQVGLMLDDGEWILQDEILRIAERMGAGRKLTALVLERAFEHYAGESLAAKGIRHLHVQLVSSLCVEQDWPAMIIRIAEAQRMRLSRLCLEITETTASSAGEHLGRNMRFMSERGVTFALDDFGTGYDDLGKIFSLPFSLIKFDVKIVQAGFQGHKGFQLMEGSIAMFKRQGFEVAAEGAEGEDQVQALSLMSCDYLQGYDSSHDDARDEASVLSEAGNP